MCLSSYCSHVLSSTDYDDLSLVLTGTLTFLGTPPPCRVKGEEEEGKGVRSTITTKAARDGRRRCEHWSTFYRLAAYRTAPTGADRTFLAPRAIPIRRLRTTSNLPIPIDEPVQRPLTARARSHGSCWTTGKRRRRPQPCPRSDLCYRKVTTDGPLSLIGS